MAASIQIGKIMGIPIRLHITFLLILPVFGWIFANNPPPFGFNDPGIPTALQYALGMSAALFLFIGVLLHELGHSYVAKRHGTNIQSITLFLFGGVSSLEEIPRNPKVEFKMAATGPGVSFLIGLVLALAYSLTKPSDLSYFSYLFLDISKNPYLRLVWLVGYINIILGIFNLIPAFPMDGGRVLRAWLAGRMSYIRATHAAANIGKMFAIFMGIFGFLNIAFGGFWLLLIAFFIYIGASEEEKATEVSVVLEGVKIKDIMSTDIHSVPSGMSAEGLVEHMFKFKHMGYPVVDDGRLEGIVTFTDVQKVHRGERKNVKISQIMTKEIISLPEDEDAVNAIKLMTINNIGRIIITKDKKMVGIVSRTDLLRSVQLLEQHE
ncbi:MAG: CBS domain-containing protein [Candidatus Methanoperedens sp.]|nr:CBS domain-containing protein [Candidatus Methanoperedens sp.]MCZ7395113.1 CBS domain-containing protein [Candidatus Methanoperedens sp.]